MATPATPAAGTRRSTTRTASLTGLYTAVAGIAVFNVAPFLDWFTDRGDDTSMSGYEPSPRKSRATQNGMPSWTSVTRRPAELRHRTRRPPRAPDDQRS